MLKREIYSKLKDWTNNSNGKTELLISGARRVGGSHICREFAKNEYNSYIMIGFACPSYR